jgi:hypothetical protein
VFINDVHVLIIFVLFFFVTNNLLFIWWFMVPISLGEGCVSGLAQPDACVCEVIDFCVCEKFTLCVCA